MPSWRLNCGHAGHASTQRGLGDLIIPVPRNGPIFYTKSSWDQDMVILVSSFFFANLPIWGTQSLSFSMSMINLHFWNILISQKKITQFFQNPLVNHLFSGIPSSHLPVTPQRPRPRLGNRFNFSLCGCQLPQSLKTLKLGEDFNQSLEGASWRWWGWLQDMVILI